MFTKSNIVKNNIFSVLIKPQFVIFSLSVVFSQVASSMLNIVLIVLTYKLTNSSFAVSVLIMTFLLPQVFLSFMGGIIADAKNKRKILLYGNAARALILLLLFFVKDSLAFVYLFQLTIAIVTQFYVPAETPIIPYLVRKEQLLAANSVFGICLFGSILVGYIIAGPAIRFFGMSEVFIFMSFLFFLTFLCIYAMPDFQSKTKKLRTEKTFFANLLRIVNLIIGEFKSCVFIIKNEKEVASSLIFLSLSQVIILVIATLIPDYAQKTLGISAEDISIYIFAPAAFGMIIASLTLGFKSAKSKKEPIINFGIFLSAIVLSLFAFVDGKSFYNIIYATATISFFAGVANAFIFIPSQTIIQTKVDEKNLSKIYGLLFASVGAMAFVPIILAGVFADTIGVRVNLIGIAILLFSIGILRIFYFTVKEK